MNVFQREIVVGEFLQTENVRVLRSVLDPRAFINEASTDLSTRNLMSVCYAIISIAVFE